MTYTSPTPKSGVHPGIAIGGAVVALVGGLWAGRYSAPPIDPLPTVAPVAASGRNLALPDPAITPGAVNPLVTQSSIHQTICVSGWAKTQRPPDDAGWRARMAAISKAYGWTPEPGKQEYDHLVGIEDGGAPNDDLNLWPQRLHVNVDGLDEGFHEKDKAENATRAAICSDAITLDEARSQMAADWTVLYRRFVGAFPAAAP